MPRTKPLPQVVTEKHGDAPAWAVAARVSDSLCYSALRGRLPRQPLLRESMARALDMSPEAFARLVAACAQPIKAAK